MTAPWQVAVPSRGRHELLARATLPLLLDRGVPADRVTIFVADEDEAGRYAPVTSAAGVGLVVAVPGMGAVRNYIARHYPPGTHVVQADDDLSDLVTRVDDKHTEPVSPVDVIERGMAAAAAAGLNLWGIYPVLNPYFMKPRTTLDLRYIVGCFWGATQHGHTHQEVELDDKEDFERTLRYYLQDGGVVRLEDVAPRTRYYTEPGGMQLDRTDARVEESAKLLARRYEGLATAYLAKSGRWELRLRAPRPRRRR